MTTRGRDAITTIPLRKSTRDRLKQLGAKGDTYDAVLNRLMDQVAQQGKAAPREIGLVDFEPLE